MRLLLLVLGAVGSGEFPAFAERAPLRPARGLAGVPFASDPAGSRAPYPPLWSVSGFDWSRIV